MQKSGVFTKIKMPNAIGQLCAVVLVGIGVTSTAFGAASVTDAGENANFTCTLYSNTSSALSGFAPDSTLTPQTDTTGCSMSNKFLNYTSRNLSNMSQVNKLYIQYCTACSSGYKLTEVTDVNASDCKVTWTYCKAYCDGLACEGKTTWTNVIGKNYQTRCNTSTNKCEYQCKSNYYNAGGSVMFGSPPNCKACPAHATCTDPDYPPCCNGGYYLIDHNYEEVAGGVTVMRAKDYECPRCPSIGGVYGTSPWVCYTEPPTPSFITKCYIPLNTNITVTEGTFQFTQDCHYTEDE